ncbi:disease resistance protein TAO1-like isoform X3 [Eucalyptus grandis]|uniref:disease resistance protein TAO1-like isoform X3 n=1 Tax=Eucalyptus grandis TaxID=71139 RepID=UPI00192EAF32|nr:disease resistance protein TAO1-like isoform X3 [Eucalyptus grandis]
MWDHCQLNPRRGIEVLTERCLIKILDNDKFWMHDQLIALGRKIVRDNSHGELGKQSRLWIAEEALDIIRIEERAHNLRVISLTECDGLTTIPDFSKCLHLQRLTLAHCSRLKRIQSFIRHLQSLIELDIEGCIGLTELPEELGALAKLQRFSLQGCSGLCELPSSFGNLTSLIELDLSSTGIGKSKKITRCNLRWIERLSRLKKLDLNLSNICALPELASLSHLEELTVSEEWVEFKNHPPSLKHLRITMGASSIELIAPSNSVRHLLH